MAGAGMAFLETFIHLRCFAKLFEIGCSIYLLSWDERERQRDGDLGVEFTDVID